MLLDKCSLSHFFAPLSSPRSIYLPNPELPALDKKVFERDVLFHFNLSSFAIPFTDGATPCFARGEKLPGLYLQGCLITLLQRAS